MNHVLPTYLKLQSKTPFSQSTISQFRSLEVEIWVQGNLSSLPHNLQFPLLGDCGSKFQTCWTTFSPIELRLESKNPLSQETFSKFWILGGGSMDTGEPSLSSSQPFSIPSSRWLWVEISDLLCFYAFYALLLLVFWFSLVKTPLAFFFPIHCEFWAWFSTNKHFKRTQWESWVVLTFFALVAKRPWHFGNSTGESSSWNKRSNVSEDAKPTKRWCFSHQLVVLREIIWYFVTQEKHGEVELK